jgi:hypothetical protein
LEKGVTMGEKRDCSNCARREYLTNLCTKLDERVSLLTSAEWGKLGKRAVPRGKIVDGCPYWKLASGLPEENPEEEVRGEP